MNASGVGRKRFRGPIFGEAPTEKVETLANEQLKKLLDKQLTKKTTLSEELRRKQNISQPIIAKDESSASTGMKSLGEFQEIMEKEKHIVSLREHGLTEEEIEIKLNIEKYELQTCNYNAEHLQVIEEKIRKHQEDLSKPHQFIQSIDVSRRELETENASKLHHDSGGKFSYLVRLKENEYSSNDPVSATLKEHEFSKENNNVESDGCDEKFIGPHLCSINERVDIIPEEVVIRNRLSLNDIHQIERFKNYKAGEASRTLYIKNLAKNISEKDLAKLFARYYIKDSSNVEYKLMKGRMRGQAFVTLKDEKTATEALLLNNGYMINDKPIIISYSNKR